MFINYYLTLIFRIYIINHVNEDLNENIIKFESIMPKFAKIYYQFFVLFLGWITTPKKLYQ